MNVEHPRATTSQKKARSEHIRKQATNCTPSSRTPGLGDAQLTEKWGQPQRRMHYTMRFAQATKKQRWRKNTRVSIVPMNVKVCRAKARTACTSHDSPLSPKTHLRPGPSTRLAGDTGEGIWGARPFDASGRRHREPSFSAPPWPSTRLAVGPGREYGAPQAFDASCRRHWGTLCIRPTVVVDQPALGLRTPLWVATGFLLGCRCPSATRCRYKVFALESCQASAFKPINRHQQIAKRTSRQKNANLKIDESSVSVAPAQSGKNEADLSDLNANKLVPARSVGSKPHDDTI